MISNDDDAGHALVGMNGKVLAADAALAVIVGTDRHAMVGRGLLDFTAPADVAECRSLMQRFRQDFVPFTVAKRVLRDDGTTCWVVKTVALAETGGEGDDRCIAATLTPIPAIDRFSAPAVLLGHARFLRESRRAQREVFGSALFFDPAWEVLIETYIARSEARLIDIATVARASGASTAVADRWVKVLIGSGQLETDGVRFCMSDLACERFESYLTDRLIKLSVDCVCP